MIPRTDASIDETEGKILALWCKNLGVRTVLEFGPGYSTNFFLDAGCVVTACESDAEWFEKFVRQPKTHAVRLRTFTANELPLVMAIGNERFDLAFIDAPKGNVFPASRINTALYAWHRCAHIAIHDTNRPGERLTVQILQALGCQIIAEPNESVRGLTLLKVKA
jgi:predicted O-methyltransferase YrrM